MARTLKEKLKTDIVLLDGAFGTYAELLRLQEADFRGKAGCFEYLSLIRPDFVTRIHADYLEAGSDAIETNTFGANRIKLAGYNLAGEVYNINLVSTKLARRVADSFSSKKKPRYVVGTMGPTGKLPSSGNAALSDTDYSRLKKMYYEQALGIIDGGADALLVETGQDLLEMKAAVNGSKEAIRKRRKDLVIMAQCTLANKGRMLLGSDISAPLATLSPLGVDVIGINCGTGPGQMEKAVSYLSKNSSTLISCLPNAGMPVERGGKIKYPLKPDKLAAMMKRFLATYRVDVIGGCCGTTPEHIRKMRAIIKPVKKQPRPAKTHFCSSFYTAFDMDAGKRPIKVGERINSQGSRLMKEYLKTKNYDGIIELGKKQEASGARILDVCAILTERSTEKEDAVIIVRKLAASVTAPVMIDSTDPAVVKDVLESYPGSCFINSVNLEDGGKRAAAVFELAKEHGSFVVALAIDERGMAGTVEDKLKTAERLYALATKKCGLSGARLIFDMLTFSLGTGQKEYAASAVNTFEAIKLLKKRHPEVLTVLGASNVSFGLVPDARKLLNMAFLHHAVRAGLDMAIVNPMEFAEYKKFTAAERNLAGALIFNKGADALEKFVEYYAPGGVKEPVKAPPRKKEVLKIEKQLEQCVLERDKTKIIPLVDEAMKTRKPEDIINGILMKAMRKVGERLDKGEAVLPYVLQSAEVMRKAIEYLEPFLPKDTSASRGKVLLATVQGDVHDIGKNLVKILLEHNGFKVIDLGKQVGAEEIVRAAGKNNFDAVGLSALLVSTARHMKDCVQLMSEARLKLPVLIGGAPINERFAREISILPDRSVYNSGVFYAKDAFTALKIMESLTDRAKKQKIMYEYRGEFKETGRKRLLSGEDLGGKKRKKSVKAIPKKRPKEERLTLPFRGIRRLSDIPPGKVFPFLDERLLFSLAWGAKLKDEKKKRELIGEKYRALLAELKKESVRDRWFDLKAVYGFFKCRLTGEYVELVDANEKRVLERFHFPPVRMNKPSALTDYFAARAAGRDIVAFQAVTVGRRVNGIIRKLNEKKEFTRAFFIHGLSVYLAEALAEYVNNIIRAELNLKKSQTMRFSPGYPLWRSLEDQEKIFRLLKVKKYLGLKLTEDHQMIPEQSTTAIVIKTDRRSVGHP